MYSGVELYVLNQPVIFYLVFVVTNRNAFILLLFVLRLPVNYLKNTIRVQKKN